MDGEFWVAKRIARHTSRPTLNTKIKQLRPRSDYCIQQVPCAKQREVEMQAEELTGGAKRH